MRIFGWYKRGSRMALGHGKHRIKAFKVLSRKWTLYLIPRAGGILVTNKYM